VHKGVDVPCLTRDVRWTFALSREVREGASVTVGNVMGVYYYEDISTHKVPESELTHLPTVTGATYPPPQLEGE